MKRLKLKKKCALFQLISGIKGKMIIRMSDMITGNNTKTALYFLTYAEKYGEAEDPF